MPACLAGQPLPAGADPYADHAWRQRLPVNPESRQFPVGVLLSSLSEIVAWSQIVAIPRKKHCDLILQLDLDNDYSQIEKKVDENPDTAARIYYYCLLKMDSFKIEQEVTLEEARLSMSKDYIRVC
ncbi:MAG: hypothetical protein ACOX7B_03205 [Christensenellales bacterium]|jgi:hypothetical protein